MATSSALDTAIPRKSKLTARRIIEYVLVFGLYLVTAKYGQYVFFAAKISPAVIWAPSGIVLAAVLLGGYDMWIPIALATLIASLTSPASPSLLVVFAATIAQTLEPVLGAYFLRGFKTHDSFETVRGVIKFFLIILCIAAIAPTIIVSVQILSHSLTISPFVSWSRSWAGRLLSILVLTPLILTWLPWRKVSTTNKQRIEAAVAFAVLALSVYLLFWTTAAQLYAFVFLMLMFVALFWIALRLETRSMFVAMFLLTALGMAGVLLVPSALSPVNQRLFSTELLVILIAPIFFVFSSLNTERRVTLQLLESNMKQLETAMHRLSLDDRSKNEFIAILAHELRNPLAPIVSTLELLKMEDQTPDAVKMIEAAQGQAFVMRRLLDDLLDVARVVQKNFKLQKKITRLDSMVRHSLDSTENFMRSRGHHLTVSLPSEKISFYADSVRFEQILVNLLNNATKYTNPGGKIELSFAVNDGFLEMRLKDNGIGIPKKDLSHIFESFRQATEHVPHTGTGLGIGLFLARRLVEMHDGQIRAESEGVGKGSTFIVTIPMPANIQSTKTAEASPEDAKNVKTFKILVVDDNKTAADLLGKLLTTKGHGIRIAYNGEDVLLMAKAFNPDIVLLDIGLPDIDGYEVARTLRGVGYQGMLIALTGYGQDEDKTMAQNAGFDYHLTKPVGLVEIENVLYQKI